MSSRAIRRYNGASSMSMNPLGGVGGAFLLINALSSKIYELLQDTSDTIIRGYEAGGLVGLLRSRQIRKLARRYLWLVAVAFAFERVRNIWQYINVLGSLTQYLRIDATLKPGDQAYEWMLAFWEHHHSFKSRSRDFVVETGPVASTKRGQRAMAYGTNIWDDMSTGNGDGEQELHTRLSPKENSAQWIWHAGTMFYFQRWTQTSNGGRYDYYNGGGAVETSMISVRSYSLTRRPLFKLLEEAKKVYERTKPDLVTVRVLDQRGTWRKVAYRHKRPLTSIIMDEKERSELLHDAKEFLSAESWYTKRGIPWKRGYLLHGSPGTGKSSTIQALASEIKLDVYVIAINSQGMTDAMLSAALRSIPPRSIVCMEDVDVSFSTQKRDLDATKPRKARVINPYDGMTMTMPYPGGAPRGSSVSLSAMLNAIDGMESNEGRLLFLTTNAIQDLDAALIRPGRVDLFIYYKKASSAQAEQLFNIFYSPSTRDSEETGSASSKSPGEAEASVLPEKPAQPFELAPHISKLNIVAWAKEWSAHVPDEFFTIAELQGMLLGYKRNPEAAVSAMPAWVQKETLAKEEAAKEKKEKKEKEKAKEAAAANDAENADGSEDEQGKGRRPAMTMMGLGKTAGDAKASLTADGPRKTNSVDKGVGTESVPQKDQTVQAPASPIGQADSDESIITG